MRDGPPDEVIAGSRGWRPLVSSWLGDEYLADVPVTSGRVTADIGQEVPERLTIQVPASTPERGWCPGSDPRHPLARYGQELQVSIVVTSSTARTEWQVPVGRFLIVEWAESDDGSVTVTGDGLLRRVTEARIMTPTGPRPGGTFASEFKRLLPNTLAADIDPALTDRACPTGFVWDEDRLAALHDIADAWPALLISDGYGQVCLRPPLPEMPDPVATLRDGERGTVESAPRSDRREGAYNVVVARSSAPDREDMQVVARQTTGPMSSLGEYGAVVKHWSTPLATTRAVLGRSARTMLTNSLIPASSVPVVCAADPRVELYDPREVIHRDRRVLGWTTAYDLPLTVADGAAMQLTVGVGS